MPPRRVFPGRPRSSPTSGSCRPATGPRCCATPTRASGGRSRAPSARRASACRKRKRSARSWRSAASGGTASSLRWEEGSSPTWPGSPPPSTSGACPGSPFPPPSSRRLAGAFHQPRAVVCDPEALSTLPPRELWSGLAEVVKCALLAPKEDAGGVTLLERCEGNLEGAAAGSPEALASLVEACMRLKGRIVATDEREGGARAFLNLGHTVGHAIEAATAYQRFTHGEAVALGLRGALRLSHSRKLLDTPSLQRALDLVARLEIGVDRRLSQGEREAVIAALAHDKKARGGKVRFVLLAGLGGPRVEEVSAEECARAVEASLS
ncbi:MAG: 3-dehydroquinate synthase [Deltaproteobacteria bacterium]|nr:MAG: 3-dehydroquinate synthase [Deltaproteobacteria bacterium]